MSSFRSSLSGSGVAGVLRDVRGALGALFLVGFASNMLALTGSMYMLQVYDRVLASRSVSTLLALTVLAVGLVAVHAILEACRSAALLGLSRFLDARIVPTVFGGLFRVAAAEGSLRPSIQPLRDLEQVRTFLTTSGLTTALDLPWIPVYLGILYLLHPVYLALGTGAIVALLALAGFQAFLSAKRLTAASNANVQAYSFIDAGLRNAEVTEALGMRAGLWSRWQARHQAMLGSQQTASEVASRLASIMKFLQITFASIMALGVGAVLVLDDQISSGSMVVASIILGRALAPTLQFVGLWQQMATARAAHDRLAEFLRKVPPEEARMPLPAPKGELRAEDLVLCLSGRDTPLVRNVTFALAPGESLAIIGPSAAGKTTLVRGLLGLWRPRSGSVRLDGADISRIPRELLGQHLGYLPQGVELFEGTVAENIARLGPVDPEKVVEAARLAGLHDAILGLPEGYDTRLGPGGGGLSPGQRQRVGLARAVYGAPSLVILDEPNANLDTEGEVALGEALETLRRKGVTTVIVTHRSNVLANVDKILLLRHGEMEEFGNRLDILPRLVRPTTPQKSEEPRAPSRTFAQPRT